ncbi:enterobactin synthase subunit EntD [Yokenella regensburgei]|uniref:enterobactin synthase subunit EntD n=1 Tax=Yokenella regensburgei TaxID=158877 RepID=UPI003F1379A6
MHTRHTLLTLNARPLHLIRFDISTFNDNDLLWLPHHQQLHDAGRKRKAEHLAGRIAAVHALREHAIKAVPGIGETGAPRWPEGVYGSISHSGSVALAVVAPSAVGIDIETLFTDALCHTLTTSIITPAEQRILADASLPFPLALTLAFSAKESLFKAFSRDALPFPGFHSAQVVALNSQAIRLRIDRSFSPHHAGKCIDIAWIKQENRVITLAG